MSKFRKQTMFDDGTMARITMREDMRECPVSGLVRYEIQLSDGHYLTADRSGFKSAEADSG